MQLLKVFVVDDDPSSRMTVGFHLDDGETEILEFDSGEACLAELTATSPDVVLLDVEMRGMNGIETCRAMRNTGLDRAQIIFISSHDDLETRLTAYDAGGSDYIVKPYVPEELIQKISLARRTLENQRSLSNNAAFAQQTAFTAMSSMGELGVALQFLKASFSCVTVAEVAEKLFIAMESYGLTGMLEFRMQDAFFRQSSNGECTPLEASILSHAQDSGRIFQLGSRLAVNYPHLTLIVTNLPVDDPDRVGRLRDHLAIIAEGADAKSDALESELRRHAQAEGVIKAVTDLSGALQFIEQRQQDHRLLTLNTMNDFISDLERAFLHMGLNERNEEELVTMAQRVRDRITSLMDENKSLGDGITDITATLKGIGES